MIEGVNHDIDGAKCQVVGVLCSLVKPNIGFLVCLVKKDLLG